MKTKKFKSKKERTMFIISISCLLVAILFAVLSIFVQEKFGIFGSTSLLLFWFILFIILFYLSILGYKSEKTKRLALEQQMENQKKFLAEMPVVYTHKNFFLKGAFSVIQYGISKEFIIEQIENNK